MTTSRAAAETEQADTAVRLRLVVGRLSRRIRIDARGSIPPLQLSILVTLVEHGPRQAGELARQEEVARSTISRALTAMGRKGLVARTTTPHDARRLLISITPEGRARLFQVCGQPTALLRRRLDRLDLPCLAAVQTALPALEALLDDDELLPEDALAATATAAR